MQPNAVAPSNWNGPVTTAAAPHDPALKSRISQEELAEYWGLSPKTLERWRVLGIGPVYIRLPGRVVYRREDIEAYERNALRQGTDRAYRAGGAA